MKSYYSIILILCFTNIYSQQRDTGPQSSAFTNNLETFGIQLAEKIYNSNTLDNVEGNYYLFKDWTEVNAKVKLTDTQKQFKIKCNYNLASKDIEIKLNDGTIYALNKNVILEISNKKDKYIIYPVNGENKLVRIIGSTKDKYFYIEDFSVEIQTVQTTTLGLFKNKFVKKSHKYLVVNNKDLLEYNRKNLKKITTAKKITKKNSIEENLKILNSL